MWGFMLFPVFCITSNVTTNNFVHLCFYNVIDVFSGEILRRLFLAQEINAHVVLLYSTYYSTMKIVQFTETWMDLETVIQSEVS